MRFFINKSEMTENEKNIEKAFEDIHSWMLPLLNQWKTRRDLSGPQSKLLFEIRDIAAGIKPVNNVTAPAPPPIPKPVLDPMEMKAGALFAKLNTRRGEMAMEQKMVYDRLLHRFEEDGHSGLTLGWDDVNFLRRLYATLSYSR